MMNFKPSAFVSALGLSLVFASAAHAVGGATGVGSGGLTTIMDAARRELRLGQAELNKEKTRDMCLRGLENGGIVADIGMELWSKEAPYGKGEPKWQLVERMENLQEPTRWHLNYIVESGLFIRHADQTIEPLVQLEQETAEYLLLPFECKVWEKTN